ACFFHTYFCTVLAATFRKHKISITDGKDELCELQRFIEMSTRLVFLPFVDNLSYCGWMISQILSGRNSCTTSSSMQFCKSFSMVL
uniref:Uncharacterized protein n=1 Tax=Haplochromis burtoni TaxID=8153 RepID=A0A3Q2UUK4_HAPBU